MLRLRRGAGPSHNALHRCLKNRSPFQTLQRRQSAALSPLVVLIFVFVFSTTQSGVRAVEQAVVKKRKEQNKNNTTGRLHSKNVPSRVSPCAQCCDTSVRQPRTGLLKRTLYACVSVACKANPHVVIAAFLSLALPLHPPPTPAGRRRGLSGYLYELEQKQKHARRREGGGAVARVRRCSRPESAYWFQSLLARQEVKKRPTEHTMCRTLRRHRRLYNPLISRFS